MDQRDYKNPKNFFNRSQSDVIRTFIQNPHIIIISGIRRCGKSTLMKLIQNEQSTSDYFINFDDDRLLSYLEVASKNLKLTLFNSTWSTN